MEITLLTETELKVSLTRDDMEHYSLDCASIDYDTTGTRRAFWSILDEARLKTGFDAAHDRIYIRLYPSRDGGCEMYVTKLPDGKYADTDTAETEHPSSRAEEKGSGYALYLLASPEPSDLFSLCGKLSALGFSAENALYVLHPEDARKRRFCFAVKRLPGVPDREQVCAAYLAEYTERLLPSSAFSALAEHGVCIARHDAAATLARLADSAVSKTTAGKKRTSGTRHRNEPPKTTTERI